MRITFLTAISFMAGSAFALPASNTVPAIPSSATPSLMGVLQVLFALFFVLVAIVACAWLLRRIGPGNLGGNSQLRVVSGAMVGQKERVVIVEVRDTWLVLGVTAANVSILHTLPKPEDAQSATPAVPGHFAERLAAVLGQRQRQKEQITGEG